MLLTAGKFSLVPSASMSQYGGQPRRSCIYRGVRVPRNIANSRGSSALLCRRFNYVSRKLHNRLLQLGATPVTPRGSGDESHPLGYGSAGTGTLIQIVLTDRGDKH